MIFRVHTKEQVHGVYRIEAESVGEAEAKFILGAFDPSVYEAMDCEITAVEEEE